MHLFLSHCTSTTATTIMICSHQVAKRKHSLKNKAKKQVLGAIFFKGKFHGISN